MLRPTIQPDAAFMPADRPRAFTADYFLCVISFFMLLLSNMSGMLAIVGFMGPWVWIGVRRRAIAYRALIANWPVLVLPVFAGLSVVWSDDPVWTLKASMELFATVVIGIMAGCCVKPRDLMAGLMTAFLLITIFSTIMTGQELANASDEAPLSGIFGSKNAFSGMMSVFMLISASVLFDKTQATIFRVMALCSLVATPVLVFLGRSLGAVLAVIMTLIIFSAVKSLRKMPKWARVLVYMAIFTFVTFVIAAPFVTQIDLKSVLDMLGKDSTLTGRTYLWDHAMQYIDERPLLGTGYGAFWRLKNPHAQELWYASFVAPGAGFNFHNEYFEILVELGIVGCILLALFFLTIGRNGLRWLLKDTRPEHNFAFMLYIFYIVRSPVEVNIFSQFSMGLILFCVMWLYFKPQVKPEKSTFDYKIYNPDRDKQAAS